MTRRNKILATVAVILLFAIFPMTTTPSSAFTSPPTRFFGTSASEPQMFEGLSAVIEDQSITFDITEFSDVNEDDLIMEQCGRVNTSYTLYNPTEEDINMTIFLPVSGVPEDYLNSEDGIETDKYKFTVNGNVIEPTLEDGNYLYEHYGTISPITFILEEYVSSEHFSTDMPVTKYTFIQRSGFYSSSVIGIEALSDTFDGSCFVFNMLPGRIDRDDGSYLLYFDSVGNGKTFDVYVFGKPLASLPEFKMYTNPSTGAATTTNEYVEFISSQTMTYAEFISRNYAEDYDCSEQDMYELFAREIANVIDMGEVYSEITTKRIPKFKYNYYASNVAKAFNCKFTIAPGERAVVSVDAPLYPSIETEYVQNTYEFSYNLHLLNDSMRKTVIDININTPYYIVSDGKTEYTKTDTGYGLTTYGAHMTDRIDFTLCEVETPENIQISEWEAFLFLLVVAFYAVVIFAHVAFDTVSIVLNEFFANIQNWFSNFINSIF